MKLECNTRHELLQKTIVLSPGSKVSMLPIKSGMTRNVDLSNHLIYLENLEQKDKRKKKRSTNKEEKTLEW